MRVLFESERVPVKARFPSNAGTRMDGATATGVAWLCVRILEAAEPIPKEYDHARPVARVLELLAPGSSHRSALPSDFVPLDGRTHLVTVPRSLLASLPTDTIVGIDWEF